MFSGFGFVSSDFFGILVFIQGSELDEGARRKCLIPVVEADEELMRIEKQIMVGLLQGLRNGVQFALIRAGVVRLALAGN